MGQACTSHHPQDKYMPECRIEPYQPPRPSIRELNQGRATGTDDLGIPPKGYLGRPPKLAYREGDRAPTEQRMYARKIQPWRGEGQSGVQEAREEE